jgi:glycosyltransferase involved in cell wall biosynthesis
MKILMTTLAYPPVQGGVAVSVRSFVEGLRKRGHEVFVAAPAIQASRPDSFMRPLPTFPVPLSHNYRITVGAGKEIIKLVRKFQIEVLHTHQPFVIGPASLAAARRAKLPLVFTNHSFYEAYAHYARPLPTKLVRTWIRWRHRRFVNACDAVIAPSRSTAKYLQTLQMRTPIFIIPTGLSLDFFRKARGDRALRERLGFKEKDCVLVTITRLAPEKNVALLFRSFARLAPRLARLYLLVVGEGKEFVRWRKWAKEKGLAQRIIFVGYVPHEQIPAYLAAGDIFVHTSLTETQGLVTVEAMAAGLPAVEVEGPGNRDIVEHGVSGLLVSPRVKEFAEAVAQVVQNEALRYHLAREAAARAEAFSQEKAAEKLERVYQKLLLSRP